MQEFIIRQLFPIALSLSLSGTLIGIFIAVIHPLTEKYFSKKWNYYIWLLVVVRLLLPFHFESDFLKLLNFHAAFDQNDDTAQADRMIQNTNQSQLNNPPQFDDPQQSKLVDINHSAAASATEPKEAKPFDNLFDTTFSAAGIWTVAAYIWLIGAIIAFFIKLFNYWCFKNEITKNCTCMTDNRILTMENTFCAGLHIEKIPAIYECTSVSTPMTIGLWKPMIVIPKVFSDQNAPSLLSVEQNLAHFQLVLHHELIHVVRKDLLYKWIYQLLLCVHWFNPVLHLIGRQMNRDCELSCDEAILPKLTQAGKQLYGNILLDTAEQSITRRQNAFSTTLLENKKDLKKRLDGILHYRKTSHLRIALSMCIFVIILTLSACSTVWISSDDMSVPESQYSNFTKTNAADSLFTTTLTSFDTFVANPDRSSDAWKVYDNDELLAGDDIQDTWEAYNYSGGGNKISASGLLLYGSDSFLIVYAEHEADITIQTSFDLTEGNFKIVYIAPDKSILTLNDTGVETIQTITMQKGRNVLKIVGQGSILKNLKINYSNLKSWEFEKIYYSEDEEYAKEYILQIKDNTITKEPLEKDKIINALYYLDDKDASDVFNVLLTNRTQFTDDELCDFFLYSDWELSSRYLSDAVTSGNIEPLSASAISELMPYLTGDCPAELLKSLPMEEFYDVFAENIYYLNDQQINECLTDYLDQGGIMTFSMYEEISPYINQNTIKMLDKHLSSLPDLPKLPSLP